MNIFSNYNLRFPNFIDTIVNYYQLIIIKSIFSSQNYILQILYIIIEKLERFGMNILEQKQSIYLRFQIDRDRSASAIKKYLLL